MALQHAVTVCGRLVPASFTNQTEVRAVGQPHVRSSEFQSFTIKQLHHFTCMMSQCIVLLQDVNFISDALDGWQLPYQQFSSVEITDDFCIRFHKTRCVQPCLEMATDIIT